MCAASRRLPATLSVRRLEEEKTGNVANRSRSSTRRRKALEKQIDQLKSKLAQAQVAESGRIGPHVEGRESAVGACRRAGPAATARTGRFSAQQMEDRHRRACNDRRFECRDHLRSHQGSDGEGPCRQTGGIGRRGSRRQRWRPAGYGGSRRIEAGRSAGGSRGRLHRRRGML